MAYFASCDIVATTLSRCVIKYIALPISNTYKPIITL